MKKSIALMMTAVLTASVFAGCGGGSSSADKAETKTETEAGETAAEAGETVAAGEYTTVKDGVLRVAAEIGYPPMEYYDEDGATPIGFDMDLARELADQMGLELELVDTAWDGIFAGVDTDKYDVVIACVSWNEERDANYLLSETYVANAPVIVVPNGSEIKSVEDLAGGKSIAVQMETTADYLMQDYRDNQGIDMDLRQYEKVLNAFDELKTGRVDAVCTDAVVAAYYLGDEATNYQNVWQSDKAEPICMCFKKGNDALKDAMETALDELRASGKLDELAIKYFGSVDPINVQ